MSATDHALELLAKLSSADRDWILGRLSAGAKSRLAGAREEGTSGAGAGTGTGTTGAAGASAQSPGGSRSIDAVIRKLSAADPDALASALAGEPSWLVSAVLRSHDWPWTRRFLQALPPAIRVEVTQLERHGTALAQPAREVVLRALVERVGTSTAVAVPATRFDAVLTRLRRAHRA